MTTFVFTQYLFLTRFVIFHKYLLLKLHYNTQYNKFKLIDYVRKLHKKPYICTLEMDNKKPIITFIFANVFKIFESLTLWKVIAIFIIHIYIVVNIKS